MSRRGEGPYVWYSQIGSWNLLLTILFRKQFKTFSFPSFFSEIFFCFLISPPLCKAFCSVKFTYICITLPFDINKFSPYQ